MYLLVLRAAAPVIVFPPEDFVITVDQFESAIFICTAAGIPPPDIIWVMQKDGESITLLHNDTTIIDDPIQREDYVLPNVMGVVYGVNRSLTLTDVLDGYDDGGYTCEVNSIAGEATREFQLVVQGIVRVLRI